MQSDPIPAAGTGNNRGYAWRSQRLPARRGVDFPHLALDAFLGGDFGTDDAPGPAMLGARILTWRGGDAVWTQAAEAIENGLLPEGFVPDLWAEAWMRNKFLGSMNEQTDAYVRFAKALVRRCPEVVRWDCERPEHLVGEGSIRGRRVTGTLSAADSWKSSLARALRPAAHERGVADALLAGDPLRDIPDDMVLATLGDSIVMHPSLIRRFIPGNALDTGLMVSHPYDNTRVPLGHLLAQMHRHAGLQALLDAGVKVDTQMRDAYGQTLMHAFVQGIYFNKDAHNPKDPGWGPRGRFADKSEQIIRTLALLMRMGGDLGTASAPDTAPKISKRTGAPVRGTWARHGALPGETALELLHRKLAENALPQSVCTAIVAEAQRVSIAERLEEAPAAVRPRRRS